MQPVFSFLAAAICIYDRKVGGHEENKAAVLDRYLDLGVQEALLLRHSSRFEDMRQHAWTLLPWRTAAFETFDLFSLTDAHSAFLACSFNFGAVPSSVTLPFSISAAHNAAPTVFVKANRMEASGTNSSRTAATPKLCIISRRPKYRMMIELIPGIGSLVLINVLLLLRGIPLLQLKISRMTRRPCPLSLQDHKHNGPHHWNEIQRQVHEIPDNRRGRKLLKWLLRQLSQFAHRTASTLDLPSLRDEICSVLGHKYPVEGVSQSVVDEKCFAENGEKGGGFRENEKGSADGGKGA